MSSSSAGPHAPYAIVEEDISPQHPNIAEYEFVTTRPSYGKTITSLFIEIWYGILESSSVWPLLLSVPLSPYTTVCKHLSVIGEFAWSTTLQKQALTHSLSLVTPINPFFIALSDQLHLPLSSRQKQSPPTRNADPSPSSTWSNWISRLVHHPLHGHRPGWQTLLVHVNMTALHYDGPQRVGKERRAWYDHPFADNWGSPLAITHGRNRFSVHKRKGTLRDCTQKAQEVFAICRRQEIGRFLCEKARKKLKRPQGGGCLLDLFAILNYVNASKSVQG